MEAFVLAGFAVMIIVCVLLNQSILYALTAGLLLFIAYGKRKGFSLKELLKMAGQGVLTAKNVLTTFLLIGVLTALWREAGTIPAIVTFSAGLMRPSVFLAMTFWLNCVVSVLTGTSFGTAATMGVICATMAEAMGIPPVLIGGAVLSGAYFGDRCSPLSTSALLVSELTETDIFQNIRAMVRTSAVPFCGASILYLLLGFAVSHQEVSVGLAEVFSAEFTIHPLVLLPAILVLVLSVCRVRVRITMSLSILCAGVISLTMQHQTLTEILRTALFGFAAEHPEAAALVNGGGVLSMLRVASIVCLSSSYSGIFRKTGLLDGMKGQIARLSRCITPYGAMLCVSVLVGMLACNQTLTIILTHQLCREETPDNGSLALRLEDSAVILAPLIPWSIAGGVPLASVGAPTKSLLAAAYLYLLPFWHIIWEHISRKRRKETVQ